MRVIRVPRNGVPAKGGRGRGAAYDAGYLDVNGAADWYVPTPETEPAAIAADQRAAVAAAIRAAGGVKGVSPVPAVVSAAVVLPASVVVRRLREIGIAPADPEPVGRQRRLRLADLLDLIAEYLRRHGPTTAGAIGKAMGRQQSQVGNAMKSSPRFVVARTMPSASRGRPANVWWLAGVREPRQRGAG